MAPLERHQLIHFPLWHSLNGAAAVLLQPGIDMLAGGFAVELLRPHPTLARHQGSDWGGVGVENLSAIRQGNLSAGGGDLLDLHGGSGVEQSQYGAELGTCQWVKP